MHENCLSKKRADNLAVLKIYMKCQTNLLADLWKAVHWSSLMGRSCQVRFAALKDWNAFEKSLLTRWALASSSIDLAAKNRLAAFDPFSALSANSGIFSSIPETSRGEWTLHTYFFQKIRAVEAKNWIIFFERLIIEQVLRLEKRKKLKRLLLLKQVTLH